MVKIQIQLESLSKENIPEEAAGALTGQRLWSLNINRIELFFVEHPVLWNDQLGHWISSAQSHGLRNAYVCMHDQTHTVVITRGQRKHGHRNYKTAYYANTDA